MICRPQCSTFIEPAISIWREKKPPKTSDSRTLTDQSLPPLAFGAPVAKRTVPFVAS